MSFSLNEVEVLARKATRGAGYPWGLAEEAARATRWLCKYDFDGCAELAGVLEMTDGTALDIHRPRRTDGNWTALSGTLCPLFAGAALSDHSDRLRNGPIKIGQTVHPMLLVPFAGLSARHLKMPISVCWPGVMATTDGERLQIDGTPGRLADQVTVSAKGTISRPCPRRTRASPRPEGHRVLDRLAHRTYAPPTEESRAKGAGAGLSDND